MTRLEAQTIASYALAIPALALACWLWPVAVAAFAGYVAFPVGVFVVLAAAE